MQPMPPPYAPSPFSATTGANPAQLGGILMIVCAVLILVGTFTRGWFTRSEGDSSSAVGLVGYKFCYEGKCEGKFFESKMSKGADADITAARYIAFLGGLAAAVLAGLGGALALARKPGKIPLLAIYIVCGVVAFFALYYIGRGLSEMRGSHKPGPGWSFFLQFVGLAGAAIIAGVMIRPIAARARGGAPAGFHPGYAQQPQGYYPPQPQQAQPPQQAAQAQPTCPRCGPQGQVSYAQQYQRYFCGRCQQYV